MNASTLQSATISFIIPHRGRREYLLATVASVATLERGADSLEIIVITQDDDLDAAEVAAAIPALANTASLLLQVMQEPGELTISALRNRGAAASRGELLAFLDADIALSPGWLRAMRATLAERPARVIASAMQASAAHAEPLEQVRVALSNLQVDSNLSFLPGRNLLLSRTTFDAIGGFPEHLATCEDYWFTDKANALGELFYSSAATYVHLGEDKRYLEMASKEVWRGQSNIQSIDGRHISVRESASFLVPIWVLIAMTVLVASAVGGYPGMALIAFTATAAPIGLYSLRLLRGTRQALRLRDVLCFYLLYFPARAIGMVRGLAGRFKPQVTR